MVLKCVTKVFEPGRNKVFEQGSKVFEQGRNVETLFFDSFDRCVPGRRCDMVIPRSMCPRVSHETG